MPKKRLVVLGLIAVVHVVVASGYVYGYVVAQRLRKALAGRIELGGVVIEPGEVATSIGYFSAGARLKDGRITFDGGVVLVPASTLTLEKGALVGTAETARLRLDGLPELDTSFERISYRLTDPGATPGADACPSGSSRSRPTSRLTVTGGRRSWRRSARSRVLRIRSGHTPGGSIRWSRPRAAS